MRRMAKKRFSDQIRGAVERSEISRYAICKEIGFNQGAMSPFMSGKGGISLDTLDRLAEVVGLDVVVKPKGGRSKEA